MALFMIFYKGKHTQLGDNQMGDNQKRGTQKGGTHVANYNIGLGMSVVHPHPSLFSFVKNHE